MGPDAGADRKWCLQGPSVCVPGIPANFVLTYFIRCCPAVVNKLGSQGQPLLCKVDLGSDGVIQCEDLVSTRIGNMGEENRVCAVTVGKTHSETIIVVGKS